MVDRSRESLMTADVPVITLRKIILKLARELADRGIQPKVEDDGSLYNVRAISAITEIANFVELLEAYGDEYQGTLAPAMASEKAPPWWPTATPFTPRHHRAWHGRDHHIARPQGLGRSRGVSGGGQTRTPP